MDNIEQFIPQVLDVAKNAGNAILAIYEKYKNSNEVSISHKTNGSPVTAADLSSHQIICAGLHQLSPSIPIVSEEDSASYTQASNYEEFWLIDPLDGTKEFLRYSDEFTVNIAFIRKGQPYWGVVHAPALNQMYWGGKKMGSQYEDKESTKSLSMLKNKRAIQKYRVIVSKSHLNEETKKFLAHLEEIELLQVGSSLKFCRIAEGKADLYPRLGPTCEWDTAAAQAVVEGVGGAVIDFLGNPLRYGKKDSLNPYFLVTSTDWVQGYPTSQMVGEWSL